MAQSSIEDLISSARNKKEPVYLRRSWIILAKSKIKDAMIDLDLANIEIKKDRDAKCVEDVA